MSTRPHHRRATRPRRLLGLAVGSLVAFVWASTTPTLSGWTAGIVGNSANSAGSASLAFAHAPGQGSTCSLAPRVVGPATCAGSVLPTAASAGTAVTGSDAITNNGTALPGGTASVSAASCAPVQLANARNQSAPLLPRYGVVFQAVDNWNANNAVTLSGGGFATGPVQQTLPDGSAGTQGYGVWFRAQAGQSGPLLSLQTSTAGGTAQRTLTLNANGSVTATVAGALLSLTVSGTFNDGSWHFAYVTVGPGSRSLTVDDTQTSTFALSSPSVSGFWHLGWSSGATFSGSLSNAVVFTAGAPPAPTPAQRASQAQFGLWAGGASSHWLLGDPGTTPYTGTHPGGVTPCSTLNFAWSFTNPAANPVPAEPLASFADGAANTYTALPAAGATQTGTVTITRNGTWTPYTAGLRLYVPVTWTVQSGTWTQTFTWGSAASVVLG